MAVTNAGSGDQACTVPTEHTLDTETTAGVYVLHLDLNTLVTGATPDVLEVKIKTKVNTGETSRIQVYRRFVGGRVPQPNWVSPPVTTDTEIVCTINQLQGTSRTIPWALFRVS
jgi:hypothetical protein